jgi:hypothetical protein
VKNGALVFDHAPRDRSGMETPEGGLNMSALIEDMQSITANLSNMTKLPEPQPMSPPGLVGYMLGGNGAVRSEVSPNETPANVIDLHRRRAGK